MVVVMIYGFTGRFSGDTEYNWNHPERNEFCKCLLFMRQDSELEELENARSECRKYGFVDVTNMRAGKLQIEALKTDLYRGFADFYEEALSQGSALVFYPDGGAGDGAGA